MKIGRTPAQEGVTVEMLRQLSDHHLETLALAFSHRSGQPLDEHDLSIPGWHCLVSFLIPKRHPVRLFKDLRPIAIIPFSTPGWVLACKAGVSALEPLALLRTVIERHLEWGWDLFMAKLDLTAAFESLPLPVAEVTLQRAGVETLV
eukprot:7546467-Heterocapsa_arctica.AAC.1